MSRLSLRQIATGVRYRIIRPFVWKHLTLGSILNDSDNDFFRSCGGKGSADEIVQFIHQQSQPRFFFHPRNRKDFFLSTLTSTQSAESILEEADHVLADRFQTLGSPVVNLKGPAWQRDFISGKEWPMIHSTEIDLLDLKNPSDVKVPWELSRFHQIWWLGKAFWLTGNSSYSEKFVSLIKDWVKENPPGKGIHWSVAMEASIRACNWIAGYFFFHDAVASRPDVLRMFLRNLLTHGLFIESHLEYSRVRGNHFLSNITGLVFLGVLFRDLACGKRWLRWAVPQLEAAMQEQVHDDGVNHEHATSYHRLVLELFYSAAILCKRNDIRLSDAFWKRLEKMFEYVQAYTRPDGSIPLVGDADDGRLFRISMQQEINDHRHALSVGAVLFRRDDLKQAAGRFDQEALWYFGGEGFERHQMLRAPVPPPSSRAFERSGFYVLRSPDTHVFVDAGEIGMRGRGGHGHNDTLSFELWHDGASFVVDPGTFTYTGNPALRNTFRRTGMHNTVVVDNAELADFDGLWSIREDRTRPQVVQWSSNDRADLLVAEHFGYTRLSSPVVHRRSFELQKQPFRLTITDRLRGEGEHGIALAFHLHPEVQLEKMGEKAYLLMKGNASVVVKSNVALNPQASMYSPSYGVKADTLALQGHRAGALPCEIVTTFERADGNTSQ